MWLFKISVTYKRRKGFGHWGGGASTNIQAYPVGFFSAFHHCHVLYYSITVQYDVCNIIALAVTVAG
jgi:hypothetical protein